MVWIGYAPAASREAGLLGYEGLRKLTYHQEEPCPSDRITPEMSARLQVSCNDFAAGNLKQSPFFRTYLVIST